MKRLRVSAHRRVRVAALLVAVAVLSAACSSSDDAKDSSDAAKESTSTPTIEVSTGASLTVRVQPSLPGPGAWELTLQEQRDGKWARVSDARTTGDPEEASWDVPAGEYRVVVPAQHGRPAATSSALGYTPEPELSLKATGGALMTTLKPVAAQGKDWSITLERETDEGWSSVRTVRANGARPVLWDVIDDGAYRVSTAARDRFPAYTGETVDYRYSAPGDAVPLGLVDAIFSGPETPPASASADSPTTAAATATLGSKTVTLIASSTPSECGSVMSGAGTDTMIASGFIGFVPVAGPLLAGGSNAAGLIFAGIGGSAGTNCIQAQFASINAQLAVQEAQIEEIQQQLAAAKSQIIKAVYALDQNQLKTDNSGYSSDLFWFVNENGTNCANFGDFMFTAKFWESCTDTTATGTTVQSAAQDATTYGNVQSFAESLKPDFNTKLQNVAGVDLKSDATCADATLAPPADPADDPDCYKAVSIDENSSLDTIYTEMATQLGVAMDAAANAGENLVPLFDQYNGGLATYYAQSLIALQEAYSMEYTINQLNYYNAGASANPIGSLGNVDGTYYSYADVAEITGSTTVSAQDQAQYYNRAQKALTQLYVARVNMLYRLTISYIVSDSPVGGQSWPSNASGSGNAIDSRIDYADYVGTAVAAAPNASSFTLAATPLGMLPSQVDYDGGQSGWAQAAALYQFVGLRDAEACYGNLVAWNEQNGTAITAADGQTYPTEVPTAAEIQDGSYDFDTECPSILVTSDGAAVSAPQPSSTNDLTDCASYTAATNTAGGSCYDGNTLFPYSANDSSVELGSAVLTNLLLCDATNPSLAWFQVGAANAGNAAGLTEGDWALTCGNWAAVGAGGWAKFPQSTPPTSWLAGDSDYASLGNLGWSGVAPTGSNSLADPLYNQLQYMTNCQRYDINFSYPSGGIPKVFAGGYMIPTGPAATYGDPDCGDSLSGAAFYSNNSGEAPLNIGGTGATTVTLYPWAGNGRCATTSSAIVPGTATPASLDTSNCQLTFAKVTCNYGTDNLWKLQSQLDVRNLPVNNAGTADGSGGFQLPVTLGVVASSTTAAQGVGGNCNSGSITLFQVWVASGTPLASYGYTAAVPDVSSSTGSVSQTGYITIADGSCWQVQTGRTADNAGTMTLAQLPNGSDCAN